MRALTVLGIVALSSLAIIWQAEHQHREQFVREVRMLVPGLKFETTEFTNGKWVLAYGSIRDGDEYRLLEFLDKHVNIKGVRLHSPGGVLSAAGNMAAVIRYRGYDTAVISRDHCDSACVLMLYAGKNKYVSEHAHIGVHAPNYTNSATIVYFRLMHDKFGVPKWLQDRALATPNQQLFVLNKDHKRHLGFKGITP